MHISVVAHKGLSCSVACGIFPDQGSNPCPLRWQAHSYPLHHQGSPNCSLMCFLIYYLPCHSGKGQVNQNGGNSCPQMDQLDFLSWDINTWMGGDQSWDTIYLHFWGKHLLLAYLALWSSGAFQYPIFRSFTDAGNYFSILLSNPISASWLS